MGQNSTFDFTYFEGDGDVHWGLVVHIDSNLTLIYILRVVIDDDSVSLAKLSTELLRPQDFITGILAWDADHIKELLSYDSKAHEFLDLTLLK